VRAALYSLAFPEGSKEKRDPVQVIATTHNPYFLDLFRDHPEEIIIAEKTGLEAKFSQLSDRADLDEILGDTPLSEVWDSGVLGGVPAGTWRWQIVIRPRSARRTGGDRHAGAAHWPGQPIHP
jgi:hypothetical protein